MRELLEGWEALPVWAKLMVMLTAVLILATLMSTWTDPRAFDWLT